VDLGTNSFTSSYNILKSLNNNIHLIEKKTKEPGREEQARVVKEVSYANLSFTTFFFEICILDTSKI